MAYYKNRCYNGWPKWLLRQTQTLFEIFVLLSIFFMWTQCENNVQYNSRRNMIKISHSGHHGRIIPSFELSEPSSSSSIEFPFYRYPPRRHRYPEQIAYVPKRRWDFDEYRLQERGYGDYRFQERGYGDYGLFSGSHYGGMDRSDFYYVLPILLVIGLGAFLIPIITTFFTALVTSNSAFCGRRKRDDKFSIMRPFFQDKLLELWTSVEKAFQKGLQKYGGSSSNDNSTMSTVNIAKDR